VAPTQLLTLLSGWDHASPVLAASEVAVLDEPGNDDITIGPAG
jgi:hypothetical protein